MSLRGQFYYLGALLRGSEWRAYMQEIEAGNQERTWRSYVDETIRHAVSNVPYYASLGLPPTASLSDFPILTRDLLRDNFTRLQSRGGSKQRITKECTGGSTGKPVWVVHDRTSRQWDYATEMYFISVLLGIPISYYLSHPRLALWHTRDGHRKYLSLASWAARLLKQVTFIEPYTVCSEEDLLARLKLINRTRPVVIWAFANPLYELAKLARRRNMRLHRPDVIISSVEMLYPEMRHTIEEAFACPVRDCYGAVEIRRVAAECAHGRVHLFTFNCHTEVLSPEGLPAKPGEEGRLVVTPLHNRAMPLLRYEIGDMARLGESACPCGSPLPVLEGITGRVIEHFVRPDGKTIYGGYFVSIFYEHAWISEFQVLQQDVDLITVYFNRMPGWDVPQRAFEQLEHAIRSVMGEVCRVEWAEVNAIPRTPIGKYLHTRSLVWEQQQRGSGSTSLESTPEST